MSITGKVSILATGALTALLAAGGPAVAQSHGGGHGGGGHGGGGHASMGGHASSGYGFGGSHFGGSGFHGYSGGFHGAPSFHGAAGFHGGTHFAPSAYHGVGGAHAAFGRPGFAGGHGFGPGRGGGFHGGWGGFHHFGWGGGFFHGVFWPRVYYGWGFPWFLPILPAAYATYWWGGVPYYYADNAYYTWNAGYNGYVATDPPPVAGGSDNSVGYGNDGSDPGPAGTQPGVGSSDVYLYPRNGQTEDQQASDRYECHRWAVDQSGFDPTRGSQASGNAPDYRRAMTACLDGRGYSAK